MTRRSKPNLSLHRETVRELSAQNLAEIEGGCDCSDICPILQLVSLAEGIVGAMCPILT